MKCHTFIILIILSTLAKISLSTAVAEPKAEPCFGFLLPFIAGLFRALTFGGFGGPLGPQFMGGYPVYPGMYYGAPYYPYPYYPYPYYQGPGPVIVPGGPVVNPGGPVVNPGGPIVNPGGPIINPGGPIINPGGPIINPGGPIIGK